MSFALAPRFRHTPLVAVLSLVFAGLLGAETIDRDDLRRPTTVSPGDPDRLVPVASATPTFSWTGNPSSSAAVELAVYPLPADAAPRADEIAPSLRQKLPAGSTAWTPPLDRALAAGDYAWFARRRDASGEVGPWSRPALFRVPRLDSTAPSAGPDPEAPPSREAAGRPASDGAEEEPATSSKHVRTGAGGILAPTRFRVNGNVDALSYTGDGSTLTNVATDAELDAHASDGRLHTTCDGKTCDGTRFSNVRAATGDSATGFFTTGSIDEARIDSEIARDDEVLSLLGGPTLVRVVATGAPDENGALLKAVVAGIGDASAAKPYTVLLGPGIYDVGEDGLTMKPFVGLQGASTASTIVTAPGDSTPTDSSATLILDDDVLVEHLTVRNTGGVGTDAFGVRGVGNRWRLQHMRIEVDDGGASVASGFNGIDSGLITHTGELVDVDVVVDDGMGIGDGSFGSLFSLRVTGSRITITGAGTGIADPSSSSGTGSEIVVVDTTVRVLGGGVGISVRLPKRQLYRNVIVEVDGGVGVANAGFEATSSLFRPILESCHVVAAGNVSTAAIRASRGRVVVRGSTLDAARGIDALATDGVGLFAYVSQSVFEGNYISVLDSTDAVIPHQVSFDQSVFDTTIGFRTEGAGEPSVIRVGSSKIDASSSILQEITAGSSDVKCIGSYDENYDAVSTSCS